MTGLVSPLMFIVPVSITTARSLVISHAQQNTTCT